MNNLYRASNERVNKYASVGYITLQRLNILIQILVQGLHVWRKRGKSITSTQLLRRYLFHRPLNVWKRKSILMEFEDKDNRNDAKDDAWLADDSSSVLYVFFLNSHFYRWRKTWNIGRAEDNRLLRLQKHDWCFLFIVPESIKGKHKWGLISERKNGLNTVKRLVRLENDSAS